MEPLISVRIRATLSANPECRPGLLARGRVAYAERGRLSHGNGRELFCLVRHYTWPGTGFFYGHVLRVPVRPGAEDSAQWPDGTWAALIVDSGIAIDGETRDEVLANAQEWRWNNGDYQPCYAQDIDDVFKLCTGFEEACAALSEMIRRLPIRVEAPDGRRRNRRGLPPRLPPRTPRARHPRHALHECLRAGHRLLQRPLRRRTAGSTTSASTAPPPSPASGTTARTTCVNGRGNSPPTCSTASRGWRTGKTRRRSRRPCRRPTMKDSRPTPTTPAVPLRRPTHPRGQGRRRAGLVVREGCLRGAGVCQSLGCSQKTLQTK